MPLHEIDLFKLPPEVSSSGNDTYSAAGEPTNDAGADCDSCAKEATTRQATRASAK